MNLRLIVAILVITAVPVCAQAQKTKATKADAQKVLKIISADKAKTQTYCDAVRLAGQAGEADEKRSRELAQKINELGKKLGPEYNAMMAALQDTDLESEDGREIGSTLEALDRLCPK